MGVYNIHYICDDDDNIFSTGTNIAPYCHTHGSSSPQ